MRKAIPWIVISLIGGVAVLPLFFLGISCGHDFDFHLLSWLEAATQFGRGGWPHWAFTPAYNAGEPRFTFYPPLSWALGGVLGQVLPWSFVPIAFTWGAITLSGFSFHRLARAYTGPAGATLAASLYAANPYMLFTAYERTAFGELLAAAFLPLLLGAALARKVNALAIAVPLALIWLTNAPAAVMSSYALALLLLVRLVQPGTRRDRLVVNGTVGTALGLVLAAFYLVPAAYESRFIQLDMATISGMRPADHFLFHRMQGKTPDDLFHDQVVQTASLIALLLLAGILVAGCIAHQKGSKASRIGIEDRSHSREIRLPLVILVTSIAFLLTPISDPVWTHLPELALLQFPWRLCAWLGAILALLVAPELRKLPATLAWTVAAPLALAGLLVAPASMAFHQTCDVEDAVPARVALFHSPLGTEATDEYTPQDADPDALHPHDPPYWLLPRSDSTNQAASPDQQAQLNQAAPVNTAPGPAPDHLRLILPRPMYLVLNRRQYPAWEIRVNGVVTAPAIPEREDGLITVALPAGADTIDLHLRWMPDQKAGLGLSALAVLFALGLQRSTTGPTTSKSTWPDREPSITLG